MTALVLGLLVHVAPAAQVCRMPKPSQVTVVAKVERPSREHHRRPVSRPPWRLFTRRFTRSSR
ncbi:MAG: hypothetical protein Q8S33_07750 [Myxococcales bacterium]|nr:hypothetical protein [Myxococcales bacterium]